MVCLRDRGDFSLMGLLSVLSTMLVESESKDLTMIVNDTSYPDRGCGRLIANKQVKHLIVAHRYEPNDR